MKAKTLTMTAEIKQSARDFVRTQLLKGVDDLISLGRSNQLEQSFRDAQYTFLWNTSLADPEALEDAYDRMIEDGAWLDMPIDSNAVFGRILVMAIAKSNPAKAAEVFETHIRLCADSGEDDYIKNSVVEKL